MTQADVMWHCCDGREKVILRSERWRADVSVRKPLWASSEASPKKVEVCIPSLLHAACAALWVKVQVQCYLCVMCF